MQNDRHFQDRRKLVHLDVIKCAELSNTVDGTKCLREPMSTSATDSKMSHGLIPRLSRKHVKSCNQNFRISGMSEFNHDYVDVDPANTEEMVFSDNHSDNVNESAHPKCSVEFVSARKYMNPTFNLLDDSVPQNNVVSNQPTCGSMLESKVNRRPNSRHAVTTQQNSLDNYFKPVYTSKTNTAQAVSDMQSHTASSADHSTSWSSSPENSPKKSVLSSPLSKLPGSNNIYYPSLLSQSCTSHSSITSSQGSPAGNVSRNHKSCVPASSLYDDDDDDLDFEASFDYIWKTNPRTKRKSSKQSGQSSKKKPTRSAEMSKMNRDLTTANATSTLQQNDAVSPNMSAENFGLFGFSNNTLTALDSDTDFEEDTTAYFSCLPPEVVSNILCRLPLTDLCLNANRVCLSWKNVIDADDVSHVIVHWLFIYCELCYLLEILLGLKFRKLGTESIAVVVHALEKVLSPPSEE